jgi:hypothetical protein
MRHRGAHDDCRRRTVIFLSPPIGAAYLRYIIPFAIAEAVLTLWLLVKGVDAERWKASALSSA